MHSQLLAVNDRTAALLTWTAKLPDVIDPRLVQQNVHRGHCHSSPPQYSRRDLHKLNSTRARSHLPPGGPENSETSRNTLQEPFAPTIPNTAPLLHLPPSRLPSPCPWGWLETLSTLLLYDTLIHIPMGLGGLSIASALLGPESLDPQTKVPSALQFVAFPSGEKK